MDKYICYVCGEKITSKLFYWRYHNGVKSYVCERCAYGFVDDRSIRGLMIAFQEVEDVKDIYGRRRPAR